MRKLTLAPRFRFLKSMILGAFLVAPAAHADTAAALRDALADAGAGNWDAALSEANGQVSRDVIEWMRLRAGEGLLGEYEDFLARRPDWPGLALIRNRGEEAVARSSTPERVIAFFADVQPVTAEGAIALTDALRATGQKDAAQSEAMRAWIALSFSPEEQETILSNYAETLSATHELRLDRLLWDGEEAEAERMLPLVSPGWRKLAEARIALREEAPGVDAKLKAVPAKLLSNPGLAYERFVWRMRKDRYEEAATVILEASGSSESLGRPEEWAERRALLARKLMRDGDPRNAYRVAASHQLAGGSDYADLEFVAGFAALRKLGDANAALNHFQRLTAAVETPISLARGAYWEGRALEALGRQDEAKAAYSRAAKHQTAYYGLLAAERIGVPMSKSILGPQNYPDWTKAAFARSSVLEAALLLQQAGDVGQSKRFFLHLAEGLDAEGLGQLGNLALEIGEPHIAVLIGKQAAERGVILPAAYYPVTVMVPEGLAVSRALALSIARRESEFDPEVVSAAGARGLMQVMPGTAKMMAKRIGVEYVAAKLTQDPAYNAALGSEYLAQMVEEFGPSIALIASGYNAGPGRPRSWVEQFGDPRRDNVDVVDWVEMIPFAETRTYVMRVAESVVIYRAKLKGEVGKVKITEELKG
jgi:soluble lytic murein transglycosylase